MMFIKGGSLKRESKEGGEMGEIKIKEVALNPCNSIRDKLKHRIILEYNHNCQQ